MTSRSLATLLVASFVASCAKPVSTPPSTSSPAETKTTSNEATADDTEPVKPDAPAVAPTPEPLYTTEAAELTDARRAQLTTFGDLGTVSAGCFEEEECYTFGKCSTTDDDSKCYARASDCAETVACRLVGACGQVEYANPIDVGGLDACKATSDAHCAQSVACAQEGLCTAVSDWDEHACKARLDADCARSVACTRDGRCHALEGVCVTKEDAVATCLASDECSTIGIDCEPIDGRCRNPLGFDCTDTTACEIEDRCDAITENMGGVDYIACHVSAASCAESDECKNEGICGVRISRDHGDGHYKGDCAMEGPTGCDEDYTWSACAKTNEGCAKSTRCASHGDCSADSLSESCRPTEAAHCTNSTNCKQHGFCQLSDESSYMVCSN